MDLILKFSHPPHLEKAYRNSESKKRERACHNFYEKKCKIRKENFF